jgi:hypothetical protein
MDAPAVTKDFRINRLLPYWAVFQADLRNTLKGWVYRFWVLASVLGAVGYLLYRYGVDREAGLIQSASSFISDLMRWSVLGSVAPIIVLTGGCISSERGIMADSVLSRGISRYQYFMGKWHARLVIVVGTFLVMGLVALLGGLLFLHEDIHLLGGLLALITVMAILTVVTTCGVTVSAISNSTVLGVAVLWMVLYGAGFALSLLPTRYPTPGYALTNLPNILRGYYDFQILGRLMTWSLVASGVVALVGLGYFGRRDV